MTLPENGLPWPPPAHAAAAARMRMHSAWYAGDTDQLTRIYQRERKGAPVNRPSQYRGGLVGIAARTFWGRPTPEGEPPTKLHIPIAADIAATSADLLFSEPPALTVKHLGTQDRLTELLLGGGSDATLLEAAEVASALGGVYLRVSWDADIAPDRPILNAVHGDQGWPEFSYGMLRAVTFWSEVGRDGQTVWRALERHEPGVILHGLYRGTEERLGTQVGLGAHDATRDLTPEVDGVPGRLCAVYVPNMRPHRVERGSWLGRSDYTSQEPLMDALDEVWTS